jgi:hypothetical protein
MGRLLEPHGVTTQKTPFFIVTAVKTSNLTLYSSMGRLLEPHGVTTQKTPFFTVSNYSCPS